MLTHLGGKNIGNMIHIHYVPLPIDHEHEDDMIGTSLYPPVHDKHVVEIFFPFFL